MEILLKVNVKNMQTESESVKKGDYIVLEEGGTVYQFQGYGYDVIYVKNVETGEELELSGY
jgi:hypothetical protein